jgi:glycosyltransferase involved in cell wall biosynthesis
MGLTAAAPRVTVIIATWNWSSVLPYSIGSVLAQTMPDFEVLVVGDGCTDDSESVVSSISDPRIRWINLSRGTGHQSGPNNEGLRQARGAIIAYLGHDDLWLPHHLALQCAAIDEGNDFTSTLVARVGPDGAYVKCALPDLKTASWLPPSALAHRAELTRDIGGWRDFRKLTMSPEADLILRALRAHKRYVLIPRLTVVKFPASIRPNVYVVRPCHEQAVWAERIRAEPDLEAKLLGDMVTHPQGAVKTGIMRRLWRLLREPSRWVQAVRRTPGAHIRSIQRYKGVDHARGSSER